MKWMGLTAAMAAAMLANQAQAATAVDGAGTPTQNAQGVTSYPASFFADARPNTAMDMLGRVPGFNFDGGSQVRGYAGAAGNVIIDGQRPATKQDDLNTVLRRIPASQVERIDIIRGGAPGIDMQGQTVLANVIRKQNGGTTYVVSGVYDYLPDDGRGMPSIRLEATNRENGREIEGSFSYFNFLDDGVGSGPHTQWDNPAVPGSGVCSPTCTARLDAKGGGQIYILTGAYDTPLAGGRLRVNALINGQDYYDNEADTGTPAAFDDLTRYSQDTYKGEFGAHYTKDLRPDLNMELVALQQIQRRIVLSDYFQGDSEHYREGDTLTESILRGVLHYRALPTLTFDGSVEGAYNIQGTETYYDVDGVAQQLAAADVRVIERRTEVAGTATWTPDPRYTLELGMKVEASYLTASGDSAFEKTLIYPKPRAVFTWSPDANDQVRLRFERTVGQIDFSAFVATAALNTTNTVHVGNPNLLPQDVWVSEAAFERKFWSKGDLTVTLRHSDISDAVDRILDPTGEFDEPGNIGHATENELVTAFTTPLDRLFIENGLLKLQATWRNSQATDPTTHTERPLTQVHPFDGEINFTQDVAKLRSTWGVTMQMGFSETYYRYDEIDEYKLGNWVQFFYEYKPTSKLSLRLELNNLTNRGFEQTYAVYAANRPSALSSLDWRDERSGQEIHLRLRKTFG